MIARVEVKPQLLRWARERARLDPAVLVRRFPKYIEWERGTVRPTLKQLEAFARIEPGAGGLPLPVRGAD